MAQNKGAIVRYRAIDRCLRSKHGKYGIEELRAACADALYDAFSERMSVSRRQIYDDLNHMESNAGYRAEIEHYRDGKKILVLASPMPIRYEADAHHGSLQTPVILKPGENTLPYKILEDNHVVIIRNNEKYDVTGKKLE